MPKEVETRPEADFWGRMCKARPESAIAEIAWNAFDADATEVDVLVEKNALDGIDAISITDNGTGIIPGSDSHDFEHLGGSWKAKKQKTRTKGRILHGKNGQGRFRVFSLGRKVVWDTTYQAEGAKETFSYTITGDTEPPRDCRRLQFLRSRSHHGQYNIPKETPQLCA